MRFGERKKVRKCFPISCAFLLLSIQSLQGVSDGIENKCQHAMAFFNLKIFMLVYFFLFPNIFIGLKSL